MPSQLGRPPSTQQSRTIFARAANILSLLSPLGRYKTDEASPRPKTGLVTVVCISDTHTTTPQLPPGDLLLHAGDLSQSGSFAEIQAQLTWLASQPHRHKVVIAGNHDLLLDPAFVDRFPERIIETEGATRDDLVWGDVVYLRDESVALSFDGGRQLTVFGSPWTQQFGNWAFQYPPIRDVWTGKIPQDTDVLVTHGPPLDTLDDDGKGNLYLLRELRRVKPALVVFGHIHAGHGKVERPMDLASAASEDLLAGRTHWRGLVDLTFGIATDVARWLMGHREVARTVFVNAAMVGGRHNEIRRQAQVVTL